ncbi:MAG: STAS domain-containing protein [Myxococcota bacterium]
MARSVPIMQLGRTLLVTVQEDMGDAMAHAFQSDILTAIEARGTSGLVIDISALDLVDSFGARVIADTARMAKLMGTETVLVGMRPEVASTLVQMGYMLSGILTALNVEDGLELLERLPAGA